MNAKDWNAVRQALLDFFKQHFHREVSVSTDLKALLGSDGSQWRALSHTIAELPVFAVHGLRIVPADMDRASTVADIIDELRRNNARSLTGRLVKSAKPQPIERFRQNSIAPSEESVARELDELLKASDIIEGTRASISRPEPEDQDQAEYTVWYGTSRRPNDPTNSNKGYSAQRDSKIHYGTCAVYIPKSHKIGSIGSSWWKRLVTMTDDRLKLLRTQ